MTKPEMLRVFVGYDTKEPEAFAVLSHSILARATQPVALIPIVKSHLGGIYWRERGPTESTEFSLTRFLVPYLSHYEGYSIFLDCDMLCLTDIGRVMHDVIGDSAVWVCKHSYQPKSITKFLGNEQTVYPCKNWSSFMVFDNAKCRALTPEYVNTASGLDLHRFLWTSPEQVGSLPWEWNWLVGEYDKNPKARILHYTLGGPWFGIEGDYTQEWLDEKANLGVNRS
jgi:hypothetical protein